MDLPALGFVLASCVQHACSGQVLAILVNTLRPLPKADLDRDSPVLILEMQQLICVSNFIYRVPTAPGKPGKMGLYLEKQGVWGQKPGKILHNLEKILTSP